MLQKSGRLVLWEAMFILELHSAETQAKIEITLVNGKKLPISEERHKYFNQQYSHLLGGEINV